MDRVSLCAACHRVEISGFNQNNFVGILLITVTISSSAPAVDGPHGGCHAQGGVHLPGPSCSGSWMCNEGTVPGGHASPQGS